MEYGAPVPFTPAEDDGRETLKTGTPAFAAHADGFVFREVSWREVASETRDKLRSFRLWLQRDLSVRFDLCYYKEETDPVFARAHMTLERVRQLASPYAVPKTQRDSTPWNGQLSTSRPALVRLNVDRPAESLLGTLAHEARHTWQLTRRDEFIPALLKSGVSQAVLEHDREALISFMESDAEAYAPRAVARWRKGTR